MSNNNKGKSLLKDIAILSSVWGPLLFLFIGAIMWKNDKFDGTIMKQLFPAILLSFCAAFIVVIILSNIFKKHSSIWWIGGIITFVAMVILYMLELLTVFFIIFISICVLTMLFILIKWISGGLR